jgi:ribose transport system permease protein
MVQSPDTVTEISEQENAFVEAVSRPRAFFRDLNVRVIALVGTLISMLAFFASQSPYFLTMNNLLNIARSASVNGIVAAGETMVLISGGLDLSISSVMAGAGMITAALIKVDIPTGWAILAGISLGVFVGYVNGAIITKLRINPLITTLATMAIVRGAAYVLSGGLSLGIADDAFRAMGRGKTFGIPTPAILLVFIYIFAVLLLNYTQFGRYVYAIGGNANACRLCGLNVDRWRLINYTLCGAGAAFGGLVLAATAGTALPIAAQGSELDIIAAVILGGTSLAGGEGNMLGTLLGMVLLSTLTNGLTMINVPIYWHQIIRGFILLIAVMIDAIRTGGYK